MDILFRTDASVAIGGGHVARCLTLAQALRERGARITFVCRELPGNGCGLIESQGYRVCRLPETGAFDGLQDARLTAGVLEGKPDWLIVDHYRIAAGWEGRLRPLVGRIMVIDDLADRPHDCDLLLDQNLTAAPQERYDGLTTAGCRLFLGPRYALLRDEFITARRTLRSRDGRVGRLLLSFGASDPSHETEKALRSLDREIFRDLALDVVVGSANPQRSRIEQICAARHNTTFHCQASTMAQLMACADLAVGAGGATVWERCYLGLPALVVVVAQNQVQPALAAQHAGLLRLLGESADLTEAALSAAIGQALIEPGELEQMAGRCLSFLGERNSSVADGILDIICGDCYAS
jgi:UDP-2,4-diacetamido-2,4,6-trideoxy-beta-L-altropyranose hydrolase